MNTSIKAVRLLVLKYKDKSTDENLASLLETYNLTSTNGVVDKYNFYVEDFVLLNTIVTVEGFAILNLIKSAKKEILAKAPYLETVCEEVMDQPLVDFALINYMGSLLEEGWERDE